MEEEEEEEEGLLRLAQCWVGAPGVEEAAIRAWGAMEVASVLSARRLPSELGLQYWRCISARCMVLGEAHPVQRKS